MSVDLEEKTEISKKHVFTLIILILILLYIGFYKVSVILADRYSSEISSLTNTSEIMALKMLLGISDTMLIFTLPIVVTAIFMVILEVYTEFSKSLADDLINNNRLKFILLVTFSISMFICFVLNYFDLISISKMLYGHFLSATFFILCYIIFRGLAVYINRDKYNVYGDANFKTTPFKILFENLVIIINIIYLFINIDKLDLKMSNIVFRVVYDFSNYLFDFSDKDLVSVVIGLNLTLLILLNVLNLMEYLLDNDKELSRNLKLRKLSKVIIYDDFEVKNGLLTFFVSKGNLHLKMSTDLYTKRLDNIDKTRRIEVLVNYDEFRKEKPSLHKIELIN